VSRVVIEGGDQRQLPEEENQAHMDWRLTGFGRAKESDDYDTYYSMDLRFHNVSGSVSLDTTGDWIYAFDYWAEGSDRLCIRYCCGPSFKDIEFSCSKIEELSFELDEDDVPARGSFRPGEPSPVPTERPED
jgi:hypothetical protein